MTDPVSSDVLSIAARLAPDLAAAAARVTVPAFRRDPVDMGLQNKALQGFDPVTLADQESERAMRALIHEAFSDHCVDGEEDGVTGPPDADWTWTLDPIDGTRSFISGSPLWTTLIALSYRGKPQLGLIDQPILGERFFAVPGSAHWQRGGEAHALRVRTCAALTQAVMVTTDPLEGFTPAEFAAFEQVRAAARLTRYSLDAYGYGLVAAGLVDLVVEAGLKPHDVAALEPVVREAGGLFTDWRGRPNPKSGQVIAAGDQRVLDEALVALRRSASP